MRRTSPEQIRKDLGRRASEIRRTKGVTQAQLAERMEVSTNYVARVEGGRENLTIDSVTKLADALEVPVLHLFLPPADRTVRPGRPPGTHLSADADAADENLRTKGRRTPKTRTR